MEIEIEHPDYLLNDQLGRDSFGTQDDRLFALLREGTYRFVMKNGASVEGVVQDTEPLDFQLPPGKTLMFQIVDQDSNPIPNVQVNIGSNPDSWWRTGSNIYNNAWSDSPVKTPIPVESDENGLYRWDGAPADLLRFSFHKSGYLMAFPFVPERDTVREEPYWFTAREEPYRITLHQNMIFEGIVLDAKSRIPVPEFRIMYGDKGDEYREDGGYAWQTPQIRSFNNHGKFCYIPNLMLQYYWLRFEADGYEPLISGPYPLDEKVSPLEILLEKLTSDSAIFATVLLSDGSPAEGVQVVRDSWVAPPNFSSMNGRYDQIVVTDVDGKFTLPKASIDSERLYFLHPQGFGFRDMENLSTDPVVRLKEYGKLEIHIDYDPHPQRTQSNPDQSGSCRNGLQCHHEKPRSVRTQHSRRRRDGIRAFCAGKVHPHGYGEKYA